MHTVRTMITGRRGSAAAALRAATARAASEESTHSASRAPCIRARIAQAPA